LEFIEMAAGASDQIERFLASLSEEAGGAAPLQQ
jgi:hypothetical protein